jgi:hypothetical protein
MENNNRIFTSKSVQFLLVACIIVISIPSLQCRSKNRLDNKNGFAVVELFTSEGCEYCPPAHDILGKIQKDNPTKQIYTLAYHVDFWDREKWKDRFSNAEFSRRQLRYAESLNVPVVYAPQIVVNGKKEFTGTDESKIRDFIDQLLMRRSKSDLSIRGTQDKDKLILDFQVSGGSDSSYLQVAIVKKFSNGKVEEGKHIGHLFTHVQTVQGFHSEQLSKAGKGSTTIKLPQGFNSEEWEVIAMVQDLENNGEISTAARVRL